MISTDRISAFDWVLPTGIPDKGRVLTQVFDHDIGAVYGELDAARLAAVPLQPTTFVFFQEHVLGKQDYSQDMKRMNGNAQIVEGVMADKAGIGYVGVGYIVDQKSGKVRPGIKVLNVSKEAGGKGFSPLDKYR